MSDDAPETNLDLRKKRSSHELADELYMTLKRLAAAHLKAEAVSVTLQPTMLVHEAYLRLCGSDGKSQWDSSSHFFVSAARAMRRILIDRARGRVAQKRGGKEAIREVLELDQLFASSPPVELLELDQALGEFAELYPQKALVVELKFFGGLTIEEIAATIEISTAMVHRDWRFARAWLQNRMQIKT